MMFPIASIIDNAIFTFPLSNPDNIPSIKSAPDFNNIGNAVAIAVIRPLIIVPAAEIILGSADTSPLTKFVIIPTPLCNSCGKLVDIPEFNDVTKLIAEPCQS